jgi:MoaD family protein
MKVRIKAYGIAREIVGATAEIELTGKTVLDLRNALNDRYPALSGLASIMIAVNLQYAENDLEIKATDEIVIIPPVSGG